MPCHSSNFHDPRSPFHRAAAHATATQVKMTVGLPHYDLNQNEILGKLSSFSSWRENRLMSPAAQGFADVAFQRYNVQVSSTVEGAIGGSTDFVSVSLTW